MQDRCAISSPATGFDEGRPGVARRPSHATNMKIVAEMEFIRRFD